MKRDATGKFVNNWDSETKQRVSISLTRTAWRSLDQEAQRRGLSRSEVIEHFARCLEDEQPQDSGKNGTDAQITLLQEQMLEQQQAIAILQGQKQELEALVQAEQQRTQRIAAQEMERHVTTILESITDAFVAFDLDWRYTYVNRGAAQILQTTPEELLGKHVWTEVFPNLVGSVPYQALHRAMAEQIPVSWEELGQPIERWLEVNAYPSRQGVAVYFRDITERKQAEILLREQAEALENQQKWLQAVLDLMPAPMVFIEPGTAKVTFSNRLANELAGGDLPKNKSLDEYPDAYYCTDTNGDRIPTERMPAVLIAQGERLENYEMNWSTPNGIRSTLCWGETLPAMYGHPAVCIGMFQDVTRLKQIEENLRQTEERLQLALSSAQIVAWDMDLSTNQVVCSPNALEVWGIQAGTRADFFAVIHPEDRQRVLQAVERVVAREHSYMQEYQIICPDGGVRWLNSQGQIYLDATGRRVRLTGVSVDITERKQIEAERDRLLKREQAARHSAETERKRLHDILMQLPAIIGIVTGPDFVYEFANPTYLQASGRTSDIIGKPIREVFPELEGQIYFDVLERVYQTGEPFIQDEAPFYWDRNSDGVMEEGFFNCVFPAWRDAEGRIQGVLMHSIEVTAQVQARQQIEQLLKNLQQKEEQQQFLIELNDAIRAIQDPKDIMWQVACDTGQHFQVTRCTYGEIDSTQEYVIVERDYCNGVGSVVGRHHMDAFGREIIAELKQGKTVAVDNVDLDPRTAESGTVAFDAIQTKSLLCVPLVKQGRFVALFVLHHISPRQWTEDDMVLMERIAQKTWLAVERSRAEEELRESEARLQLALRVGRMGTWDWDMQTNALVWSEGHFTVLGLQPNASEPSYEAWARRLHPDDLAETEAKLQQAIADKKEYYQEYRLRWSDGAIHWVEARGQFTYDAHGNPKHSIGAIVDITERKQAEQEREQLLERERIARSEAEAAQRQLTTIFETSPIGLALLDAEQRFIAINEALAEINGLTREQHLGYSIPELFGEFDPKIVEVFEQIYTTGNPFISPNFAVNVPGRSDRRPGYYNVYYLPTTNLEGRVESVLVYVVDVTDRFCLEQAQRFLAEASKVLAACLDYQTTLTSIAQLVVPQLADWCTVHIVDETGTTRRLAVAHVDPAKVAWANELEHHYPHDPNAAKGVAHVIRTGQSELYQDIPDALLVESAHDAKHLQLLQEAGLSSVMIVPLRVQERSLGTISFVTAESGRRYDLADLALAEELGRRAALAVENAQLYQVAQRDRASSEAARRAAESANRVKDEFLAVLSHELRSPLNPILGWTKMLRSKRLDSTKTEQALETIERNAKLQAQLIEDLLDVSRILQGKMTLNVAPVNLVATIEAGLETVQLAAEAKSIQIQTILNPIFGTVSGDTNRLQQVVWNLLSNAVKFTPAGGRVEVRLDQVKGDREASGPGDLLSSPASTQSAQYAQITVTDTGKGISPDFLPHVFDYFRQEDGTITRQFGGLGLGLAIVRHLTELHGGTVYADSRGENSGSTFTVRLPLHITEERGLQTEDLALNPQSSALSAPLAGVRVLVVDDDADMRELAVFILMQSGAEVTIAASAAQALTLLNQSVPDLLLCDIGMPDMDGYALMRQIRKLSPEQGGTLPAIALTAYAGGINQQRALAAGFQMHISKPVEPEALVKAIASLIARCQ